MYKENCFTKISCWLQGDDDAFEDVFRYYQPRLFRYTVKYLRSEVRAEDATMEILVKLWQKRNTITGVATFENYLFTIARNYLVNEWRKRIDSLLSLEEVGHQLSNTGPDIVLHKELDKTYRQSLSALPEQRRKVFLMHREESLTYKEIAEKLDISPRTVENQMSAALKHLRSSLAQHLSSILL